MNLQDDTLDLKMMLKCVLKKEYELMFKLI